ncbi:MAG: ABC transporter ATP-binding protein [Desulfarculaceae bacterium]|nr:ABC transporter ATP-binding protein [Desulfarculaceae bacterium]MCF8047751.1 ABC transporter ATP-binding protein [Desulfarculaceae bacterium]MCF8065067.1 ABC transporter ATP-binding protein [Desulfarculaceae bacterium]
MAAVSRVNLSLFPGEVLGVVGESGCGKSVTARAILRIIPIPPGDIERGQVLFQGRDLLTFSNKEMEKVRGGKISMIFQEPMTSLNPAYTVGDQIAEVLRFHRGQDKKNALKQAVEMLSKVEIPDPVRRARSYPYQLSGGMRQRAMIAMALACQPRILIADEPTTALDVTTQAQILRLIKELQTSSGMSVMLITHNLGVVASLADQVVIMYAGRVVEQGPTRAIFYKHHHPYTNGLLRSLPRLDQAQRELIEIPGTVPRLEKMSPGCAFANRCDRALAKCTAEPPPTRQIGPRHYSTCWLEANLP